MANLYPEVNDLSKDELDLLCQKYREYNYIDIEECEKLGVKRGLRNVDGTGVLAGLTNVADVIGYKRENDKIIPIDGDLLYRGISIKDIVTEAIEQDRFMFEEVAWLLLFGSLPNSKELERFTSILENHRELPDGFAEMMIMSAPSPNIMNKMARSVLAMYAYDENAENNSLENIITQSVNLVAQLPTMMVYAYQTWRHVYEHQSMFYHFPKKGQSTAEHILSTYRQNQEFTHEEAKLLDLCLVVQADHGGGNNSAFTTRVLSSTGTDTYSAIASAICSLKGPKHGGANMKVMEQLDWIMSRIEDPNDEDEIKEILSEIIKGNGFDKSGLIYGIGHAVYTLSDPRAEILKNNSKNLAFKKGFGEEWETLCAIEKYAPIVMKELKGKTNHVCANLDLYSGLIYRILGINEVLYTPIFAIARVPGWCAHRMEEVEFANRIIRPAYKCTKERHKYVTLKDRKNNQQK